MNLSSTLAWLGWLLCANMLFAQNVPQLGQLSSQRLNLGSGSNFLIVSNVHDGDPGVSQPITVTVTSGNTSLFTVQEYSYHSTAGYILIELKELNTTGSANLTVHAQDADGIRTVNYPIQVGQFLKRGVRFSLHDIVFWQRIVPLDQKGVFDSIITNVHLPTSQALYNSLPLTVGNPKHDFFTSYYEGFLQVTTTGVYRLSFQMSDEASFYLSPNSKVGDASLLMTSLNSGAQFALVTLTGGQVYSFYAAHWCVHNENFRVNI